MYKKFIKMKKYTITEGEYDLLCAKLQSLENENIRLKGYIKGIKEQLRIGGVSGSLQPLTTDNVNKMLKKASKETWIAIQGDEHGFKEWYAERCKLSINSNDR